MMILRGRRYGPGPPSQAPPQSGTVQLCTASDAPPLYISLMGTSSTLLCIHRDPGQLRVLKENGYELATATNGSDGLRLFRSRPVDAVVLEHHLSQVDGTAIADEIKRARPEIPIVMLVDHLEVPSFGLKSVDALVAKSDGDHFLWAMVHFVLNGKPGERREAKLSAPATEKDAPFSRAVWQGIRDGEINF
jgi:CheY-like chemotaxis protein